MLNIDRSLSMLKCPNVDTADSSCFVLERLFSLSPALLCIATTDAYFKKVNPAFELTLGYSEGELLSRSFLDFVHPDDRDSTLNEVGKLAGGLPAVHFENRYRHADGSYRWLLWNSTPVAEEGLLYASAIDITERKQADEKYRRLQAESTRTFAENERKLQVMTNRLLLAEEKERRRIARGLHDDVGQILLAAKILIGEMNGRLSSSDQESAKELKNLIDHAIQSTRSLSFDLATEALYDVGLGAALQSLCQRAQQRSGIHFISPEILPGNPIPKSARVILYRVGRELIRNTVKHSGARTAKLSLTMEGGLVQLVVQDDGCGFDVSEQRKRWDKRKEFGLFSIEQQLRPIGGTLSLESLADNGTCAKVTLPLASEVDEA